MYQDINFRPVFVTAQSQRPVTTSPPPGDQLANVISSPVTHFNVSSSTESG